MTDSQISKQKNNELSIVCLGASAGGLESYIKILSILPADTGFAFIIIQHQPAKWKTLLTEILSSYTAMPVVLVEEGEIVKPDHVYIAPSGMQVHLNADRFSLSPLVRKSGWPQNISVFLHSLAANQSKNAIAVILSGLDADGVAALKPIKEAGGIVIAQDLHTAKQPDMPLHAVNTGYVDFLLSPVEIAEKLCAIAKERTRLKKSEGRSDPEIKPVYSELRSKN
ncbi:Protein-glutamate methylesterase [Candidatus Methylobacter favarea]|uniref:protein-glutamate methylesterase n=1 Tax=Candidatus Methylobacter favarea TaxID=2707345 RepID=A0A8S0XIK4_9GAMM|nr:chemotaxis protein CheB [Candidatus Methylobacter favarea]CAA9890856.1 Protein-glutamate methylesterase [Candidatus Methylobacter favarea]